MIFIEGTEKEQWHEMSHFMANIVKLPDCHLGQGSIENPEKHLRRSFSGNS